MFKFPQIFMGTPHRGSDLAFWGSILAGIAKAAFLNPSKNIKELKNNSSTLMDVSEDFRSIAGRYYIVSFYEDTKIKGLSKEVRRGPSIQHIELLTAGFIGCWQTLRCDGNNWRRGDPFGGKSHGNLCILRC